MVFLTCWKGPTNLRGQPKGKFWKMPLQSCQVSRKTSQNHLNHVFWDIGGISVLAVIVVVTPPLQPLLVRCYYGICRTFAVVCVDSLYTVTTVSVGNLHWRTNSWRWQRSIHRPFTQMHVVVLLICSQSHDASWEQWEIAESLSICLHEASRDLASLTDKTLTPLTRLTSVLCCSSR